MAVNSDQNYFPATAWSCIKAAGDKAHPEHVAAVNRLIGLYWRPVFCHMRARGMPFHDALDMTQSFFLRMLEDDSEISKANQEKGRFRNYLKTLVNHFLSAHSGKKATAQARVENRFVSVQSLVGEEEQNYDPPDNKSADQIFEWQWTINTCQNVLRQLKQRYVDEERADWYEIFVAYRVPEGKRPSQHAVGERFGKSRDEVRSILDKASKRFERLMKAELREEGVSAEEIDQELGQLSESNSLPRT